MIYEEQPMSPEDREELDFQRRKHFDELYYGPCGRECAYMNEANRWLDIAFGGMPEKEDNE
jgi:hypothetical protein